MERYKSGLTGKGSQTPDPKFEFKKTEFKQSLKLPKASTNPRASDYLKKRKLNPMKFYYAEKFMTFCNKIKPGSFSTIKKLPIFVVEGPFDSTFLNNCVALCGSDGDVSYLEGSDLVFVYDNEPRNKEIVSRIGNTIKRGYKVVIWPNNIRDKDLNDMHLSGHDVKNLVESNIYSGLEATLQFNKWKKV